MKFSDSFIEVPPGGWTYVDPDTGLSITSTGPFALLRKINEHRAYKKLDEIDRAELEAYFTAKIAQSVAGVLKTG